MSKAFTKESEAEADVEGEIPALPAGAKNYIPPDWEAFGERANSFQRAAIADRSDNF